MKPTAREDSAVEEPKRPINWHRVTFWGILGVATVFITAIALSDDHRLVTPFQLEGRDAIRIYVRRNHPEFAARWHIGERDAIPKITPASLHSR